MIELNPPSPGIDIPADAVFESSPVTPHDQVAQPKTSDALHISGKSTEGDVVEYLHYDDTEKTFTTERVQDVEPVLESAKRLHLDGGATAGKNAAGDFYHAARVPLILVERWLQFRGLTMRDFKGQVLKDFLNDADHSAFRIWPGRV